MLRLKADFQLAFMMLRFDIVKPKVNDTLYGPTQCPKILVTFTVNG